MKAINHSEQTVPVKITPKSELERIDKMIRNSSKYKTETVIQHQIWMEIVMEYNTYKGKKQQFWSDVLSEYKTKYRNN